MKLQVLQLISSAGFFGAESVVLELAREIQRAGHEVTVAVFNNLHKANLDLVTEARRQALDTEVIECRGRIDLRAAARLARFVRERSVDVIHSHGYKSNTYAWLSNRRNRRMLVSTCHNWINASTKMRLYTQLDRLVLKQFHAVVPVSRTVREQLLHAGFSSSALTIVENGVCIDRFRDGGGRSTARAEFGVDDSCFVIGTVGRLSREKAHAVLLRAAQGVLSKHPDCRVLLVGDGEDRAMLKALVRDLNIADRVVFAGARQDVPRLLHAMDLFVLPSLVEAQPMSLLEAMAAGVPVVASDVGDVAHILQHGRLGDLVRPGDVEGLGKTIEHCLENRDHIHRRAQAAREHVVRRHSSIRMAQDYLNIYARAPALQRAAKTVASAEKN